MRGVNWNSKTRTYTPIVREATRARARRTQELSDSGWTDERVAAELGCSIARVREYCMWLPAGASTQR